MSESYRRYDISQERALSVAGCASVALSSLLALEKHEKAAATYLENLESEVVIPDKDHDQAEVDGEAQARKTALLDQVQALRRDLAELAADAAALLPAPEGPAAIVIPKTLPPPRLDLPAPLAVAQVKHWYMEGTAAHLGDAAQNADRIVRHLSDSDDPDTMNLCAALRQFVQGVRGARTN